MKKIKVLSFAKFQGAIGLVLGLIAGILYAFGGLLIDALVSLQWITTNETPGLSYGTILAFGALIGMPVIGGTVGFVIGLVEGVLYNTLAKWLGILEINFER